MSKSSDVYVDIAISDVTEVSPRIAVYISENGGELKRSEFIDLELIDSIASYKIAKSLSPSSTYNIEVRVVGVSEFEDRWDNGGAISVASVRPSPGGLVAPWVDDRAKVLFIGDSIVEGVAAKKEQGSITRNSAGDEAFGTIAAQLLDMSVINNGYGGVGLLVPGSGGWPAVPESTGFYMRGLHVTGESPKVIVAMLGTNDKVTDEEFESSYVLYMNQLKREYPDSKVMAMVPFSQRYSSAISSASKKSGVPLIETSGWGVSTTDGVHPDTSSSGHRLAGEKTAEAINKILGV
ncbi:GDSL-type esterase/lipase family protein [Pseudomonas marginalis]|uniref:GDSL-type esterase/lipase family protein n=1 Tax=Pseudomonas TaxID=286 RepID=UPI00389A0C90